MEKKPCDTCGALILPTTAESTGGVCMACKQGIRKSMEDSRAYYQRLKEYDPFYELWKSLVNRSSDDPNISDCLREEKIYFSVCLLEGDAYNGGFDQYFSNRSGNYYFIAVEGLEELGATNSLSILREAATALLGNNEPPSDQTGRWKIMNSKARQLLDIITRHRRTSRLERLDKQFWKDPDHLGNLLRAYAEENRLIDPFLNNPN